MAEEMKISAPSGFPIGNCKVTIDGSSYSCSYTGQNLEISVSNAAKINISVVHGESDSLMSNLSFLLINPKEADDQSKALMQVIAALTYQIIPADTQYAEVPLATVSSNYQHKVPLAAVS